MTSILDGGTVQLTPYLDATPKHCTSFLAANSLLVTSPRSDSRRPIKTSQSSTSHHCGPVHSTSRRRIISTRCNSLLDVASAHRLTFLDDRHSTASQAQLSPPCHIHGMSRRFTTRRQNRPLHSASFLDVKPAHHVTANLDADAISLSRQSISRRQYSPLHLISRRHFIPPHCSTRHLTSYHRSSTTQAIPFLDVTTFQFNSSHFSNLWSWMDLHHHLHPVLN